MAIEVDRLIATLEAKVDKFEKSLAKASGGADRQFKKIEDRGSKMEARLSKLGIAGFKGLAAGALAAVGSVLSLSAAIDGAKAAMEEFGNIADSARSAGLDPETFQELAYAAQQGGVEFGQFSGALETFAKNAGLAVVGKGKMVAALKALNPELLANIQAATTQEERINLAADAIKNAGNASERAALSTALFGDAGSKLAGVFEGGSAAIAQTATEARRLGIVVSNDLIARADELGDSFDTATKVLDLQFKQALIELAPFLIGTVQLVGGLAAAVRGLIEAFSALESRSTATLEGRAAQIRELIASQGTDVTLPSGQIVPSNPMAVSIGGGDSAAMQQELAQIEAILSTRRALETMNAPASAPPTVTAAEVETRNAAADAAIRQAEAVQTLVANLQFEQSLFGKSAEQQNVLTQLRNAGVDATSKQGQYIAGLIQSIDAQKAAQDRLNQSMQENQQIAQQAGAALAGALSDGKLEAQELLGVLADVGKQLLLNAIANAVPGGSLITSFLGGLFGGGRASGGPVEAGKGYIVGEKGPEPFFPKVDGTILPNKALGGAGGQIEVVVSLRNEMLDARIDNRAANVSARVTSGGLATYDQALPGRSAEKQARYG